MMGVKAKNAAHPNCEGKMNAYQTETEGCGDETKILNLKSKFRRQTNLAQIRIEGF